MALILEKKRAEILSPTAKRWTTEELDSLLEQGLLSGRYELVEGMLNSNMGSGGRHALFVNILMELLLRLFGSSCVRVQQPMRILGNSGRYNRPEPDLAVSRKSHRAYRDHPLPEDLLLVVEVSDSTLQYDLTVKANLYAQVGIAEYWVLDIEAQSLMVHRQPTAEGYEQMNVLKTGESLSPVALPNASFLLAELFANTEEDATE